ncbi:MAG: hypothetical protein O7J95_10495 [Planctomycetota bacterium]|nr:hypothetical protein [Planctomycetota bacterium]
MNREGRPAAGASSHGGSRDALEPVPFLLYPDVGEFLTLEEAQNRGLAVVREIGGGTQGQTAQVAEGSGSATVNTVVVGEPVEAADPRLRRHGDQGGGGNQDRQIAQDFIVSAGKTVPVEAFCIEPGRWSAERAGGLTNGLFRSVGLLAAKSVASAQYEKSQGTVWKNVLRLNSIAGNEPATGTFLATIEEDDAERAADRKRIAEALRKHPGGRRGDSPACRDHRGLDGGRGVGLDLRGAMILTGPSDFDGTV